MLWWLCDIWFVCFGILDGFCIIKQYLCGSRNSGAMTTLVHTNSVCRLGVRQTEGPASLGVPDVPMLTQRWDVCHPGPVFAWLTTESPAGCLVPQACVCWGKRRSHIQRRWRADLKCLSCHQGQKEHISHNPVQGRKIYFIPLLVCWCKGDWFGLAGGQTECQSCHGGGWPYQPSIDAAWRQMRFYRTHARQGLKSACRNLLLTRMAALLSAAEYFNQFCASHPLKLHLRNKLCQTVTKSKYNLICNKITRNNFYRCCKITFG